MSGPGLRITFVNSGEEILHLLPHGDVDLHLWTGLPGDDGALVSEHDQEGAAPDV